MLWRRNPSPSGRCHDCSTGARAFGLKRQESEWAYATILRPAICIRRKGMCLPSRRSRFRSLPGLYHYAAKEHGLELRQTFLPHITQLLAPFPPGAFLFGLSSVHWREAWKYGERAFRYYNHDVGRPRFRRLAAATLGWTMVLLDGVDQNQVAQVLGTHRAEDFGEAEPEHPDCLAVIWPRSDVKHDALSLPCFWIKGRE